MSERFFSDLWYRVAEARPSLRPRARLARHVYRGDAWYVLEDRLSGKSHRLSLGAWVLAGRMDGRRTVDSIWRTAVDDLGPDAPSQDDALTLLGQLHAADLLRLSGAPDVAELLERRRMTDSMLVKQNVLSPLSFRIPLVNPDRFLERSVPLVRWLVGPLGLVLWLAICLPAALLAIESWPELTENLSDRLLSGGNLLLLVLVYPVVKALHELGHGYVAKAHGAEVPEMGIMFLVFFPVPYVDATAASAFRSKWRRAAVGAAGIMVELLLAALALYAWRAMEPGLARAALFNVMAIGGISTLLVNGNPLLRFDGYFVLTDVLEVPNLAQRASRFWGHLCDRYLFRAPGVSDFHATRGERGLFLVYAPAAFAYRVFISITIALFIASTYFFVGVVLAMWSLTMGLGKPVAKALWHVATGPRLRRVRGRAVGVTAAGLAVLAGLAGLVPAPLSTTAEGVIWLPETAQIRARAPGFVEAVAVAPGETLAPGTPVAHLVEPVFEAELRVLEATVVEARRRLERAGMDSAAAVAIARLELEEAAARRDEALARQARRTVVAPAAGRFAPIRPLADLPGRWLQEGELIAHAIPDGPATVRVVVTQADVDLIAGRLRRVWVFPPGDVFAAEAAALLRTVPAGQFALPAPALGSLGGGAIPVDPRDTEGLTALNRVFQLELEAPPAALQAGYGGRVRVRFELAPEPVGRRIWRRARQLVLSRLDA